MITRKKKAPGFPSVFYKQLFILQHPSQCTKISHKYVHTPASNHLHQFRDSSAYIFTSVHPDL